MPIFNGLMCCLAQQSHQMEPPTSKKINKLSAQGKLLQYYTMDHFSRGGEQPYWPQWLNQLKK